MRVKEREFKICAAENLFLSTTTKKKKKKEEDFEEVHFKASFEGRDSCDEERKEGNSGFQNTPILRNKPA